MDLKRKEAFYMQEKKLGLPSVVATGVGLIVATSCLLSLGQGSSMIGTPVIITMVIACAFNILTAYAEFDRRHGAVYTRLFRAIYFDRGYGWWISDLHDCSR